MQRYSYCQLFCFILLFKWFWKLKYSYSYITLDPSEINYKDVYSTKDSCPQTTTAHSKGTIVNRSRKGKDEEVEKLIGRLQHQRLQHRKQLEDLTIEQQQQQYFNEMMKT